MKTAYSYARFSSKKQAKGDSLRRQIDRAEKWCSENGYRLDESLVDKGVSGFRGRNSKKGALSGFLLEMEAGTIRPGSALIVESPDRLSREPLDEATDLFKRILRAGITIITLTPFYEFRPEDRNDLGKMIVLESMAFRAHEESKLKSERVAASKDNIRRTGLTKLGCKIEKCPLWLELHEDRQRYVLIPAKAKIVRFVFRLAAEGYGIQRLAKKLSRDGVPTLGKSPWSRSGLLHLLRSRTVLGEFQQHVGYGNKSDRKPVGEPIKGYYPAVVEPELFYRVQAEFSKRSFGRPEKGSKNPGQRFNGTIGANVSSLFSGLCIDARNGSRFNITYGGSTADDFPKRFVSYGSLMQRKGTEYPSIPYDVFETTFLTWTKELKAKDVLPNEGKEALEETVEANEAKLAEINKKVEKVKAKIVGTGDVDVLYDVLLMLDKEQKSLTATIERLKAQLHSSETASLEETQELIGLLANTKGPKLDELRQRLKNRIQRLITEIRLVVHKKGMNRLVFVQVFFAGGKRRSFLIGLQPIRKSQFVVDTAQGADQLAEMVKGHYGSTVQSTMTEFASKGGRWLVGVIGEDKRDLRRLLHQEGDLRNPVHAEIVAKALAG